MAQQFADRYSAAVEGAAPSEFYTGPAGGFEGIVLETVAPATAILLVRNRKDYYDEGEVVLDPYRLAAVNRLAS